MDLLDHVGCALLAGVSGGVAGWGTVRRMLRPEPPPRRGSVMRRWPGPGHGTGPPSGPRSSRRRWGRR